MVLSIAVFPVFSYLIRQLTIANLRHCEAVLSIWRSAVSVHGESSLPLPAVAIAHARLLLPQSYLEPRWYAVRTSPRHEKKIGEQLVHRSIECFVPLYETEHRWKDRRARVQLPLFPGYVFVHIALKDRLEVLQLPSVANFVSFQGQPAPISEAELQAVRCGISRSGRVEPHPFLKVGRRVRIKTGPLASLEGILVRKKDSFRLVLSIELIMRSVAVEIGVADVEPI